MKYSSRSARERAGFPCAATGGTLPPVPSCAVNSVSASSPPWERGISTATSADVWPKAFDARVGKTRWRRAGIVVAALRRPRRGASRVPPTSFARNVSPMDCDLLCPHDSF